ncbi:MAG: ribonuclease HII [Patescibacteria group bacterium]
MATGYMAIVGVDEVGTGAFAGPVVAAAVILPLDSRIGELADSKLMSPDARERVFDLIINREFCWGVGEASVIEIQEFGLRPANYLAMRRAIEMVRVADFALVDAWTIPELTIPQRGIVHGDRLVKSIAAASVIAKVTRDRLMVQLHEQFPVYGFSANKGYGTMAHQEAIKRNGPSEAHRVGFIKSLIERKKVISLLTNSIENDMIGFAD